MRSAALTAAFLTTFTSLGAHAAPLTTTSLFWGDRSAWSAGEFPLATDDVSMPVGPLIMTNPQGGAFQGQARVVSGPQTRLEIGSTAFPNASLNAARLQTGFLWMRGGLLAIRGGGAGNETELGNTSIFANGPVASTMTVVRSGTIRFGATTAVDGSLRLGGLGSFVNPDQAVMTVRNNQVDFDKTGELTLAGEASLINNGTLALEGPASIAADGFPVRLANTSTGVLTAGDPDSLGLPAFIEPAVHNAGLIEVTSGTLRIVDGGVHDGTGGAPARLAVAAPGRLELQGTHEIRGDVEVTGDGRVELLGASPSTSFPSFMLVAENATLTLAGDLFVQSAPVGVDGVLRNSSTGRYFVNDNLSIGPNGVLRQEGLMSLSGDLEIRSGSSVVAATGRTEGQGDYTQFGGTTTVEAGGVLNLASIQGAEGSFLQTDGTTTVNGLLRAGKVEFRAGSVGGSGVIKVPAGGLTSAVTFGPGLTVEIGNSPGALTIDGNLTATGTTFDIEIEGRDPGTLFDQLIVNGEATIDGGILNLRFIDGFVPGAGDVFDWLVTSGGVFGVDTLTVNVLSDLAFIDGWVDADGRYFVTSVVPVPLPPAAWALGTALLALGGLRRRVVSA
jgi:hypothetical protein